MTKAGLVGTGLVGGSVGLALRRAGILVRGYDRDAERAERAVALGAIDEAVSTIEEAAAGADIVFVAVPWARSPTRSSRHSTRAPAS